MNVVKLHNIHSPEPVGSTVTHFGYQCVVKEDGVYASIPDNLIEVEVSAGRVRRESKPVVVEQIQEVAQEPVVEVAEQQETDEPVVDDVVDQETPLSAPEVVEHGTGKRRGRKPKE